MLFFAFFFFLSLSLSELSELLELSLFSLFSLSLMISLPNTTSNGLTVFCSKSMILSYSIVVTSTPFTATM